MRVAYCTRAIFPQHGFGGLERAATGLLRHLLRRGLDLTLYTRELPPGAPLEAGDVRGRLAVRNVPYGRIPLPPNGIPARLTNYRFFAEEMGRKVRSAAMRQQIGAVYAHGLCAWGVRGAAEWGVPVIANPHGMEEFKISDPLKRLAYAPFRAWLREGYRSADRVVATDHSMQDEVSALLGIDPARVVVLPNGVDVAEIRSALDPQLADAFAEKWQLKRGVADAMAGISVGRMEANKGFDHLLRALVNCKERLGESWHWFFVGDGTQRGRLEALAAAQGLIEYVTFTGSVTDAELHTLYSMCNLFVHPTLYEGSSLVTLEAMAHGLPVIASATGGIPDKVADGVTGFLVKPGDEVVLGERIAWMSTHPLERRQMGLRGLEIVSRRFSWTQVAEATEALLYTVIEEKAACNSVEVKAASC